MENKEEETKKQEQKFPGYPEYPASEDIYAQGKKAYSEDGEEIKDLPEKGIEEEDKWTEVDDERRGRLNIHGDDKWTEKGYAEIETGEDLDVPGAELDDDLEVIGEEDEENNYYSMGGDNHDDLDEREDVGK